MKAIIKWIQKNNRNIFLVNGILAGIAFCLIIYSVTVLGMTSSGMETADMELSESFFKNLTGAFMPLISMSGSPFLTLALLSGSGYFLNAGILSPDFFGETISESVMKLPISNLFSFVILTLVTLLKIMMSMLSGTKLLSDAILGKIEKVVGSISAIVITFLWVMSRLQGSEKILAAGTGSQNDGWQMAISIMLSLVVSMVAYFLYLIMRTTVSALDLLALLCAPIPGATAVLAIAKNMTVFTYTWLMLTNPKISMAIGLVFFLITCLLFKKARRMEVYYREIYLKPLLHKIFRKSQNIPLAPEKLPRSVAGEFENIELCLPLFSMNRLQNIKKKDRCYFVKAGDRNYIFRKTWFGRKTKIEIADPLYLEICFRFIRIFSHEEYSPKQRKYMLILSREYKEKAEELIWKAGMIDYQVILQERKRELAEQKEYKKKKIMNKMQSIFSPKMSEVE